MSDIVDRANEEAEAWIEEKLRQQRWVTQSLTHPTALAQTDCLDCGEAIGEQRKQALPHAVRCIKCQTELERGKK